MGLNKPKGLATILFFASGLVSLVWFLIRVIPKPSRISYPCMKVTMPVAYSFIMYLVSVSGSFLFFKKAIHIFRKKRFYYGFAAISLALFFSVYGLITNRMQVRANTGPTDKFVDPLGPNAPIGEAKGILPGRVVWNWDPNATNENCTNSSHSDAYWLETNCDQDTVDAMISEALRSLTGENNDSAAWDAMFRYFNSNHGKSDTGYVDGETIFIKINAVTAWSGAAPDGEMPSGLGIEFDTSPQSIMSILRQLVYNAGVPEENIYVGDPLCDIWNTLYDKFYTEFPNVHYVSKRSIPGRTLLHPSTSGIHYSDHGTVMTEITSHNFYTEMLDADYMINIPSLKGHRWAGITLCAKNHFGSNTTDHSWELHKGLMKPDNDPFREGYHLYRVQVDLMACQYLGGKTMLYLVDGLWATSYEHQKPQKFRTAPFNSDWCSSIICSLDPVAVESVCLDILQKEFTEEDMSANPPRYTYVQWNGIDDYLHQAASSEWWPEDIIYDPDETGDSIPSLGVHEHWNNADDMEYSRNLGTGEGIDLVKLFHPPVVPPVEDAVFNYSNDEGFIVYPNPCRGNLTVEFESLLKTNTTIQILSMEGKILIQIPLLPDSISLNKISLDLNELPKGIYIVNYIGNNSKTLYSMKLNKE